MALSQTQIIISLGEAMKWLEKELQWGVSPSELRHLSGRIGELYVAMMTNGQMALDTNQKGYDVVSKDGERISVKTTTMSPLGTGHVTFNAGTLDFADRVIVLWLNAQEFEIETLFDKNKNEAEVLMSKEKQGKRHLLLASMRPRVRPNEKGIASSKTSNRVANVVRSARYGNYLINELETGTIQVFENGVEQIARPLLTKIAIAISISTINANGNALNTRQLGTNVIARLHALA